MTIHKEGRTLLLVLLPVLIAINAAVVYFLPALVYLHYLLGAVSVVFYFLVLQFFRHPRVHVSADDGLVYAPADGKVVVIEKAMEPEYLKEERIQLSIFMSPLNVHVNRSPIAGKVAYYRYHAGKYLVAWHPKSSTENERTSMVVEGANGVQLMVRQIAGAVARRIKFYAKEGQAMAQGEEFGFIKFGSRVDLFLPLDAEILVDIDTKTKAGRTPLARI